MDRKEYRVSRSDRYKERAERKRKALLINSDVNFHFH